MIAVVYEQMLMMDTSAILALHNTTDSNHRQAVNCMTENEDLKRFSLDVTAHESYTRARYAYDFRTAIDCYEFLRSSTCRVLRFTPEDEESAMSILRKFSEHSISFHDALCAAVMLRNHIYRIFAFDRDFYILGFEVLPGRTF